MHKLLKRSAHSNIAMDAILHRYVTAQLCTLAVLFRSDYLISID